MTWWWVLAMAVPHGAADPCAADLVALDRERAVAFATADPSRLTRVYTADSGLLAEDRAAVQAYAERGGRVLGALLQVSGCRVVERGPDEVRLDVTDALGPSVVRWDGGSVRRLPVDRPTRRVVVLRMTPDGWRVSASRPAAPR